jgi:hypothetical protein
MHSKALPPAYTSRRRANRMDSCFTRTNTSLIIFLLRCSIRVHFEWMTALEAYGNNTDPVDCEGYLYQTRYLVPSYRVRYLPCWTERCGLYRRRIVPDRSSHFLTFSPFPFSIWSGREDGTFNRNDVDSVYAESKSREQSKMDVASPIMTG